MITDSELEVTSLISELQVYTQGHYFSCVVVICVCPTHSSPSPLKNELTDGKDKFVTMSEVSQVLAEQYPPHNRFYTKVLF